MKAASVRVAWRLRPAEPVAARRRRSSVEDRHLAIAGAHDELKPIDPGGEDHPVSRAVLAQIPESSSSHRRASACMMSSRCWPSVSARNSRSGSVPAVAPSSTRSRSMTKCAGGLNGRGKTTDQRQNCIGAGRCRTGGGRRATHTRSPAHGRRLLPWPEGARHHPRTSLGR
jgi:hypothetical protein